MMWQMVLAVVSGFLVLWAILLVVLRVATPDQVTIRDALRLLPDLLRLIHGLARDATLPRGVRVRLGLLLAYLALPIDLVPDFLPVIGYADDAIIVALVLRSVIKHAGPEAITRHWSGTDDALRTVLRLSGMRPDPPLTSVPADESPGG